MDHGPHPRDLRCFVSVARNGGFSRAAAELGMSQPAVSQAISRLERGLGVRLFGRTSREVRLSSAGKALLPHAESVLDALTALTTEAARLTIPEIPAIRLAYAPLVGVLAARVARRLARRTPPIAVELTPLGRRAATAALERGEASAAILGSPFPLRMTTGTRFHVTVGHLAVPAGDPLAARGPLRPAHLARHKILMPRERPPGGMWERLAARLRGPHQHHVVADEIDDFAAALDLVAAGAGLLPVPHLLISSIRRPDITFVPFDADDLRLTFGLTWPPDQTSPELMALVRSTQETLWTR
ncbi:LysR family transcriptional regulator [Sphaerisporangium siamense]|uniref:DNA-binding transcriptional LysR family regulator n=1 Tax=Sphaerisporangium siamense TaxID=795645 RepID=A0A7W7D4Q5_9ACTN|nr:LysR family transcriptional regulator [Sphaerisporangium siamense]MBB4700198.1 DNA-binding transcriptional LysR family regulator [Sphaerisporangium siamense]GII84489.1 LysR family transcriptional regulator [Sphaerisporangium siamense]